jgi:hypothetical protein
MSTVSPTSSLNDSDIRQLEVAARLAVGEIWLSRAKSELRVGARFEQIRAGLGSAATSELNASLMAAALDEARHSELCAQVAAHYAGDSLRLEPPAPEPPLARFGDTDPQLSVLLHLVLQSCINEATSTVYLRSAMKLSRGGVARSALRQLLADDVNHARFGWAYLASTGVTSRDREHVAHALPTLLRLSQAVWSAVADHQEPWYAEHGCAGRAIARAAFETAVHELVLPGMTYVGVNPDYGRDWLALQLASA